MDPIEAALSSSFSAGNIPSSSSKSTAPSKQDATKESTTARGHLPARSVELEAERLAAMDDSWREEYDERMSSWKAENAARRQQSERTREEWEKRASTDLTSSFPTASATAGSSISSSFVDARDMVTGEGEGGHGVEALNVLSPSANEKPKQVVSTASGSGEDNSQGWENVPDSLASSYPSINFAPLDKSGQPIPSKTGAPGQARPREALEGPSSSSAYYSKQGGDGRRRQVGTALALPSVAPPSVTLSIFDSSLSRRARLLALASSLAINLVLPFINGIMLGFGEIAAKSLFGWNGWGEIAGSLGLRNAGSRKRAKSTPVGSPPTLLTMP